MQRALSDSVCATTWPHEGVFTRLGPSSIHGVGVFAIRDIPKGTMLFRYDPTPICWFTSAQLEMVALDEPTRRLYRDFCIFKDGRYGLPASFDGLTMSWYLNEPAAGAEPNVAVDASYDLYALLDIATGEELTLCYAAFNDPFNRY